MYINTFLWLVILPSIKNSSFSPELLWQNSESRDRNTSDSRSNTSHFATIQALVDTDDEVIILDPSDCYEAPVLLCKAKPVRIALNDDLHPNWQKIKACSSRTKMIIINNPHNPTGKILTKVDLMLLKSSC
jgi:hypothetical protein